MRVANAMSQTPCHEFVPTAFRSRAYDDIALEIDRGQTISRPFVIALMTELLDLSESDAVLEIGTGSGYQTAILAAVAAKVYSIEIIGSLHRAATKRLERLGYKNISTRLGDGRQGWPEKKSVERHRRHRGGAEGSADTRSPARSGGGVVLVVRPMSRLQKLTVVEKSVDGKISQRDIIPVDLAPLADKG